MTAPAIPEPLPVRMVWIWAVMPYLRKTPFSKA